jgi:hypothetical protein
MLKLFENRFINTMNKLAVSVEVIKHGRSSPPPSPRAGSPTHSTTLDFMLHRATLLDHQRLMKELSDMLGWEREKEQKRECDRQEERARDEHRERERDVLLKNMGHDIVLLKRMTHDLAQGCYSRERTAGAGENAHKAGLREEDTIGSDWDLASDGKASDGKDQVRGNRDTQPTHTTGTCLTHDIVSVLTEQHNSLLLALAAQTQKVEVQTQKLDQLEQVCLHLTRSDEPMFEEVHQTVGDLKERLGKLRSAQQALAGESARERRPLSFSVEEVVLNPRARSLQRNMSDTDDTAAQSLFGSYSPQDKEQRVEESKTGTARKRLHALGNELKAERFEVLKTLYLKYKQPFSAAATDGICQGTPTVLNVQADLVQTSNHTGERGGGRDMERLRALSSRARSSMRPQSDITGQSRSDLADGGGGGRFARLSRYQPVASIQTDLLE